MTRVFIVNQPLTPYGEPFFDVSMAEEYGQVIHLLPPGWPPDDANEVYAALATGLCDFNESDFIVPVGDMSAIVMAVALATAHVGAELRWLEWRKSQRRYVPRRMFNGRRMQNDR